MPRVRALKRTAAKSLSLISPDDIARHTEEYVALSDELIELARDLCEAASELNTIVRVSCISPPTRD
jgi:hypothetical protein